MSEQTVTKEKPQTKENGEQLTGKKALLRPTVVSMKEHMDRLVEVTQPGPDGKDDISVVQSEATKIKSLADRLISLAKGVTKAEPAEAQDGSKKQEYQYVAKVQGLHPLNFKDMRNLLQNSLGLGSVKFSPTIRNSNYVEINFTSEELMDKALKIIRGKPLGLNLCVIETRKVDKQVLPPENVLETLDTKFDPIIMFKESLLRSRELTKEEYNKMVEWKEKFIEHVLSKTCEKLEHDLHTVIKDRTNGYFFKLDKIRAANLDASESERYQTYSGLNPETGHLELGYWALGSDVPSRIPRSKSIQKVLKVLTDFMELSDKPFYDLRVRKGYWDSIMIRSNHVGHCMVVLIVRSGEDPSIVKNCTALKSQLSELLETGPGKDCNVKSVHLKVLNETGKAEAWHLLYGEEYLDEEVAGLKVRLYKNTFFWGDGGCTEQLCETVADELAVSQNVGVLELGVGTGLICMYLAKRCKMVCGLDRVPSVLSLAKVNLELNNLSNVVLVQGSATATIPSLKTKFKDCSNVFAVVTETSSNARSKEEIMGMRKSPYVNKVAYLIISYKDVTSTLKLLCSKNADTSEPFVIVKVIPFDVASTSIRPDILVLLERASTLGAKVEKRVPKSKAKGAQSSGPPAKKAKLTTGPQSTFMPKKFGGNPLIRPVMPGNKGPMGRGFTQYQPRTNLNFIPSRSPVLPWAQNNQPRSSLLPFNSGMTNSFRMNEEAMLLERARQEKEAQIQQMQEAVLEAQRRRLANSLLPSPQMPNIEEVVLSAIKKTGLLEKVAALSDVPAKSQMDVDTPRRNTDNWSRFREQHIDDRDSYRQQDAPRSSRDENVSRYQGRISPEYPRRHTSGRDTYRYQDRDNSDYQNREDSDYQVRDTSRYQGGDTSGYQNRDTSGYQNQDNVGYQGRDTSAYRNLDTSGYQDTSGIQGQEASGFQSREASGFQGRETSGFQGLEVSGFQSREVSGFQGNETSGFQGRDTSGFQGRDTSGFQARETSGFQGGDTYTDQMGQDSFGFQARDSSSGYQGRDISMYQDQQSNNYQGRDLSGGNLLFNSSGGLFPSRSYN